MESSVDSSNQDFAPSSVRSVLYFCQNTWKFAEFIRCLILCKHIYYRRLILGFSYCVPLQINITCLRWYIHAKQSSSPVPLWTCFLNDGCTLNHRPARVHYPVPWNIVEINPRINLCAKTERVLEEGNRKLLESGCATFFGWMPHKSWCTSFTIKLYCDKMRHFQLHCMWSKRFFELMLFWSAWN